MEYCLTQKILGSRVFVTISKNEYDAIQQAREGTLECLFLEEKYDLVVENYLELETALLEIVARNIILRSHSYKKLHLERGLMDRRFANLLAAAKLYVDQAKQHVHRILKHESEPTFDVNAALSAQYDARFGYRCMDALRNHVQHRGSPVHGFMLEHKLIERQDENLMLNALTPYVEPGRLKEDGEFKKSVLKEMEAHGEKLDLKALIRDYVEGLSIAHSKIRAGIGQCAQRWDTTIKEALQRYASENPEGSTVGLCAVRKPKVVNIRTGYQSSLMPLINANTSKPRITFSRT